MNPLHVFLWLLALAGAYGMIANWGQLRDARKDLAHVERLGLNGYRLLIARASVRTFTLRFIAKALITLVATTAIVIVTIAIRFEGITAVLVALLALAVVVLDIDSHKSQATRKRILDIPVETGGH